MLLLQLMPLQLTLLHLLLTLLLLLLQKLAPLQTLRKKLRSNIRAF
jgi:hypothetical protein